ncbi:MAG: DUF2095 family protein [Candidatus Thorarchaeota archaeon]
MPKSKKEKGVKKESSSKIPREQIEVAPRLSFDNFEEHFPALFNEIKAEKMALDQKLEEISDADPLTNYFPDVFDFLARAKTDHEGHEIITFLEKDGQIGPEQAANLREQLSNDGIRSFGPLRTRDFYFRKAAEVRQRRLIEKRYNARRHG